MKVFKGTLNKWRCKWCLWIRRLTTVKIQYQSVRIRYTTLLQQTKSLHMSFFFVHGKSTVTEAALFHPAVCSWNMWSSNLPLKEDRAWGSHRMTRRAGSGHNFYQHRFHYSESCYIVPPSKLQGKLRSLVSSACPVWSIPS